MPGSNFNDDHERVFGASLNRTTLKPSTAGIVVTAGAYTDVDVVGGTIIFDVHSAGGGGIISDIYLTDAANQAKAYKLYLFDNLPTAIADNDAWDTGIDIDDLYNQIAEIDLTVGHYLDAINSLRWAHIPNVDQKFATPAATPGYLYMYLVCVAGPTFTATTDVQMSMLIQKN